MLVAAAAAIGNGFAPPADLKSVEPGTDPPGDFGYLEALSFQPDPLIFDDRGIANLDPAWSGDGADGSPGLDTTPASHEIYFVDLDPDNSPVVPENITVDQGMDNAADDQGPATVILPEFTDLESASDDSTDVPEHVAAVPDANVALTLPAPTEEQLHTSASEAPSLDEEVSVPARNGWVSNYSFAEITEDEASASHAVAPIAEVPSVTEEKAADVAWETDDCSRAVEASEHAAALIREPRPDARRWIVVKANNAGTASSKKATDVALSNALRPGRNLPVPFRGWPPPARSRSAPRWPITRLQAGIVALALVDFLLVGWRTDIVRKLPQTASFYELAGLPVNLRGLAFHGITTTTVRDGGKPVLVVEGDIVNNTAKALRVPQLRFAVRDSADQEIYFWTATATRGSLPPGQAVAFRARLASPPAGARDVVLRFVNRHDAVAMNP
jgi:hypothetical protein